jgi:hypothetical protein
VGASTSWNPQGLSRPVMVCKKKKVCKKRDRYANVKFDKSNVNMWKPLAFGQGLFIKISPKNPLIVKHLQDLITRATGNNT